MTESDFNDLVAIEFNASKHLGETYLQGDFNHWLLSHPLDTAENGGQILIRLPQKQALRFYHNGGHELPLDRIQDPCFNEHGLYFPSGGIDKTHTFTVKNPTDSRIRLHIETDDSWVCFSKSRFILEPDTTHTIEFLIDTPKLPAGNQKTNIKLYRGKILQDISLLEIVNRSELIQCRVLNSQIDLGQVSNKDTIACDIQVEVSGRGRLRIVVSNRFGRTGEVHDFELTEDENQRTVVIPVQIQPSRLPVGVHKEQELVLLLTDSPTRESRRLPVKFSFENSYLIFYPRRIDIPIQKALRLVETRLEVWHSNENDVDVVPVETDSCPWLKVKQLRSIPTKTTISLSPSVEAVSPGEYSITFLDKASDLTAHYQISVKG